MNDPGSSLIKVSILGQLSDIFIKNSLKHQQDEAENVNPLGWKAILYMSAHFAKEITSEGVAERFGSNVATLNRELRNISSPSLSISYMFSLSICVLSEFLNKKRASIRHKFT